MIKLYDYFRSSASFRVRIALNLKELPYTPMEIHLVKEGGQHLQTDYAAINPQKLVPTLLDADETTALTQSLAIIEYLEEQYPTPALLPHDPLLRAQIRAFAQHIACDIHPLNNLRVLQYLTGTLQISESQKMAWYFHWLQQGFTALETLLAKQSTSHPFCFGKTPTLADICLIPQVYNARRFEFPMHEYPRLSAVNAHCLTHAAFTRALPENSQPLVD